VRTERREDQACVVLVSARRHASAIVPAMDPLRRLTPAQKVALARQFRLNPAPAERHAWSLLRNRCVLGLKFRRQHILHGFVVDFYCAAERLVVELEGDVHDASDRRAYDIARAAYLEAAGYRVVRIRNHDVSQPRLEKILRERLGDRRGPGGED